MKYLIAIFIAFTAASCESKPVDTTQYMCVGRSLPKILTGPSRSLADLEKEGLRFTATNPNIPQVPFARAHPKWLKIKEHYRKGDLIRAFHTIGFEGRIFTTGYALSRNGCIVEDMTLSIS